MHGFAGSAAMLIIVASSASGLTEGLGYVLAFGIGTTIGMTAITAVMAIPISMMAKANKIGIAQVVCGVFSVTIGAFIMGQALAQLIL